MSGDWAEKQAREWLWENWPDLEVYDPSPKAISSLASLLRAVDKAAPVGLNLDIHIEDGQ